MTAQEALYQLCLAIQDNRPLSVVDMLMRLKLFDLGKAEEAGLTGDIDWSDVPIGWNHKLSHGPDYSVKAGQPAGTLFLHTYSFKKNVRQQLGGYETVISNTATTPLLTLERMWQDLQAANTSAAIAKNVTP